MSETQLASMFIGSADDADGIDRGKPSDAGNIHIIDGQTDEVLGHINKKYVLNNKHEQDLSTNLETFNFTTLGDKKFAEHLGKRNGLIIPGEDGEMLEFRIFESIKYRDSEGLKVDVYTKATYLDLKKTKVFDPHKTTAESAQRHAELALAGTEWQIGEVAFKGVRTLEFDDPFNPYDYLKRIAREFELELRFYVTHDGSRITGRYVDLVDRVGEWRGRTIEFGRDLQRIERKENTDDVVTALWVYGPEKEDGTRLKVFVEDNEARERWGRKGKHIVDYYEPQTDDQNITESRLRTLGEMELKKRINAVVTYEADILDLENVPGMENKKIRFGDTIRIKDTKFNPPLYVEARVFNVKRDVFNKAKKTVQLGDYVEYSEDEVKALFKQMQAQIQQKISAVQAEQMIEEYAEPKKVESPTPPPIVEGVNPIWIDTSKVPHVPHIVEQGQWVKISPTEANEVGAETPQGAQEKADTAEQNAKSYTDIIKSDLEDGIQQAMDTADGKNTVFRQSNTPPTTNRKIGDLWFKTDEGNKMFVWTGSAWTETKLDHQALSVGKLSAISADLGTVTAGHIQGVTMNLGNGQFVVDSGNVKFAGHLEGASGTFEGVVQGGEVIQRSGDNYIKLSDRKLESVVYSQPQNLTQGVEIFTNNIVLYTHSGKPNTTTKVTGINLDSRGLSFKFDPNSQYFDEAGIYGTYDPVRNETHLGLDFNRVSVGGIIMPQAHNLLSLINGWQNYGGGFVSAAYTKTADGYVHLRGLIRNGAIGTVCGILPVGCRPYGTEIFAVNAGDGHFARITITTSGSVTVTSATTSNPPFISLSGISFRAEN